MRIGRTIPPAATPLRWRNIFHGVKGAFNEGIEVERFGEELKAFYGKKHCFLVSSGKTALTLILLSLKERFPDRKKVVIPAFTCFSVPSAIMRAGLEVTVCDVEEGRFDFNFKQLESILTDEKLLCVIPTHLYGNPANVEKVRRMLKNSSVAVVEDAAQSFGGFWKNRKIGLVGDAVFISLGRGKAFSTVEGGIILTDNDDCVSSIDKFFNALPSYGFLENLKLLVYAVALKLLINPAFFWLPKGLPFLKIGETIYDQEFKMLKLSGVQAGLSRRWMEQIFELSEKRKQNGLYWKSLKISANHKVCLPEGQELPDLLRFPIEVSSEKMRLCILEKSDTLGLGITAGYPSAVSDIGQLRERLQNTECSCARRLARQLITLPIHPLLTYQDRKRIKSALESILGSAS